jgi:hypothetical protein
MTIESNDVTGTPRSNEEIQQAIKAIEREIVRNPMAKGADGTPMMFHYLTIRDALKELMGFRVLMEIDKAGGTEGAGG